MAYDATMARGKRGQILYWGRVRVQGGRCRINRCKGDRAQRLFRLIRSAINGWHQHGVGKKMTDAWVPADSVPRRAHKDFGTRAHLSVRKRKRIWGQGEADNWARPVGAWLETWAARGRFKWAEMEYSDPGRGFLFFFLFSFLFSIPIIQLNSNLNSNLNPKFVANLSSFKYSMWT
jgi:hypothetical protein